MDCQGNNYSILNLVVRSYAFHDGFGVPTGTAITYQLDPQWKRFVAVVGLAEGSRGAGPYQIHLDGKLHWSSGKSSYGRNDPAAQIDVSIPPGHKQGKTELWRVRLHRGTRILSCDKALG